MNSLNLIIEQSLIADLHVRKSLNEADTTGIFDYAKTYGTDYGWNTSKAKPWVKNKNAASILKTQLYAQPFATDPDNTSNVLSQTDLQLIQKGTYKGKTGIGYQVLMYSKEIGTNVYFYENGTMEIGGMANNIWGYEVKNSNIYIRWNAVAATKPDNFIEGYITRQGGRNVFVDTSDVSKASANNVKLTNKQQLMQYIKKNKLYYGNLPSDPEKQAAWEPVLDVIQTIGDWVGILLPPVDIANAIVYAARGRYLEAFFSIVAFIPVVGDIFNLIFKSIFKVAAGAAKITWGLAKVVGKFVPLLIKFFERAFAKYGKRRAKKMALDAVENKSRFVFKQFYRMLDKFTAEGLLSKTVYDKWYRLVTDFEKEFSEFLAKRRKWLQARLSGGKLAAKPVVAGRLGLQAGEELAGKAAAKWTGKVATYLGKGAAKIGTFLFKLISAMFRRPGVALHAAYDGMLIYFKRKLSNPKFLAMTLGSFADKNIIKEIFAKLYAQFPEYIDDLAKRFPSWFETTTGAGFKGAVTVKGLNPEKLYQFISHIVRDKSSKIFEVLQREVSDIITTIGPKDGANYYWDVIKTSPWLEFRFLNFNPIGVAKSMFPRGIADFGRLLMDFVTTSRLWKMADVVYNEYLDAREKMAGLPNITHTGVVAVILDYFGVFDSGKKAKEQLEKTNIYKRLQGGETTSYSVPGATDSTTFQSWDLADLDPATNKRYTDAWKKSQKNIKSAEKRLNKKGFKPSVYDYSQK